MGWLSRKSETGTSTEINRRTGQPFRSESQAWNDFAADADRRAAEADSKEGRKAMEGNAADFRRRARRSG